MSKRQYTIELPVAVGRRVDRMARRQRRNPAELAVEAVQSYLSSHEFPVETPTAAELRAMRGGEAAIRKGDCITLDEYFRTVGNPSRRTRKKVS